MQNNDQMQQMFQQFVQFQAMMQQQNAAPQAAQSTEPQQNVTPSPSACPQCYHGPGDPIKCKGHKGAHRQQPSQQAVPQQPQQPQAVVPQQQIGYSDTQIQSMICRSRNLDSDKRKAFTDRFRAYLGSKLGTYGHRWATMPRSVEEVRRMASKSPLAMSEYTAMLRGLQPRGGAPFITESERYAAMQRADSEPAPAKGEGAGRSVEADF